ncbi:protein PAIR1 [Hordeum vulgare]|nr:protein PAIR1 [Hordeum vulgare]
MKLKINKACDLASISVLPPRRTRGSNGGGGGGMSAPAAASAGQQQGSQTMSQKSFSQGGGGGSFSQGVGASFSQGIGSGGASFSQGSGGGGVAFSQGGGGGGASFSQGSGGGGAAFSQGGGGGGAAFSQGGGSGGAAFSQAGGSGGAAFSQGGGGGGAAFSQGGGGGGAAFSQGGGSASLLHAQSQLSQASLDESLLSQAPARSQRFALQEDSSKRMSSYPASSASSCVRDESQLQLAKITTNPIHRWSPSLPDSRCQVNEDVERKFHHVASSVHKMGMILDSVQNDVMQLNRAMKEASLDSGSIQKKFVLLEDSLKQILKGQDDLKAVLEESTKRNPDQLAILNSHTRKLDAISSLLSVFPKQVQTELGQLKGDIFRIFTKEMEGVVRAFRSLNSSVPGAMQMLADQSCTTNAKTPMKQAAVANGSPLMNHTPVADGSSLMNQGPVADRRPQKKPMLVANGRPKRKKQPDVANGRPQRKNQAAAAANGRLQRKKPTETAVANGRAQRYLARVANGRPQVKQTQAADGRSQTNQKPEANEKALIPVTKAVPAPVVYQRKAVDLKPKLEHRMVQKLADPSYNRPALPKEQELAIQKVDTDAPINKVVDVGRMQAMLSILIDSDEEEEEEGGEIDWSASCVILKLEAGCAGDEVAAEEAASEGDALEILRRARKRRRREANANAIVLVPDQR